MRAAPALRELCHELSQPLMAARGSLELALHLRDDDPARPGFFDDALAALERMADLTRAIRDAVEAQTAQLAAAPPPARRRAARPSPRPLAPQPHSARRNPRAS
ncbi:MAG TPA: hypothetical protein VMV31_00700 [Terriglobales bacterium]|nr:hypothetical protein [Terriglobales bacterium]